MCYTSLNGGLTNPPLSNARGSQRGRSRRSASTPLTPTARASNAVQQMDKESHPLSSTSKPTALLSRAAASNSHLVQQDHDKIRVSWTAQLRTALQANNVHSQNDSIPTIEKSKATARRKPPRQPSSLHMS